MDENDRAAAWGKQNGLAIHGCDGPHEFVGIDPNRHRYKCTHKCKKCGGEVHALAVGWYLMGLAHGRAGK